MTDFVQMNKTDMLEMFRLKDKLTQAELSEHDAKLAHAEAKKATEAAQKELNEFIESLRHPNLFKGE